MPNHSAVLYLFIGLPSCGKSSLTKEISQRLQIKRISTDETWKEISPESDWSKTERIKMYSATLMRIKDHLSSGEDIIVDGVYSDEHYFQNLKAKLENIPYKIRVFKIECSLESMLKRFRSRKNHEAADLSEQRLANLKRNVNYTWFPLTVTINMDENFQSCCEKTIAKILNFRSKDEEIFKRRILTHQIILSAGKILKRRFRQILKIHKKGIDDFVTNVDIEINDYLESSIRKNFPLDQIKSEESESSPQSAKFIWHIDPIDGTHMFMSGIPTWCISIACSKIEKDKEEIMISAVYDPNNNDLFEAEKNNGALLNGNKITVTEKSELEEAFLLAHPGFRKKYRVYFEPFRKATMSSLRTRVIGVTALEMCYIGAGFADIYISAAATPHDMAAGLLVAKEAGAEALNWEGNEFKLDDETIILGNKTLAGKMVKKLSERGS